MTGGLPLFHHADYVARRHAAGLIAQWAAAQAATKGAFGGNAGVGA